MKPTLNEKFLAYLALFSGLFLSLVAEYYSILGLTAIFSAAVIPVVIMGIALGLGKVTATLWLKQNWKIAPWTMRGYLFAAIIVLMMVTSLGIFGFLSKAHSDQSLVSGDVQAKISVYDEKIKTAKENIDANRKALKQMDESVDQVMGRSQDEKGADKAVALRRGQAKERTRLLYEITTEQKTITQLSEERAPIAAEVRKVEAEVGPIKYIAAFVYGETNEGILEKAVTWVIVTLIVVFDPMAVILLLSSQISFQDFRKRLEQRDFDQNAEDNIGRYTFEDFEKPTKEELKATEGDSPEKESDVVSTATVTESEPSDPELDPCYKCGTPLFIMPGVGPFCPNKECGVFDGPMEEEKSLLEKHPYLTKGFAHFENLKPMVMQIEKVEEPVVEETYLDEPLFVQNEEQRESDLWSSTTESITKEEYQEAASVNLDPHNDAPHPEVAEYIELVKSRRIALTDVPEELILAVKARI
jgi:hypothetical protein